VERNEDLRWAEGRLIAFALGALDHDDEARVRSVLSEQDEYEDILAPEDSEDIGHVPVALLARWTDAGRRLRGIERSLVLDHVTNCGSCREDLELLGMSPVSWGATVVDVDTHRGSAWMPWVGGTLLGVAASMVLFMALPREQSPVIHGVELDVVTPSAMRGSSSDVLSLSPDTAAFILATALPSDVAAGTRPVLVILDPDGRRLSETELGETPWSRPSTQVVLVADPVFAAGEYSVQLEVPGESAPQVLGGFRIEHSR
jgi:hypothetical protein